MWKKSSYGETSFRDRDESEKGPFQKNIEHIKYFLDDDESAHMRICYWEIFARYRCTFMNRIRRIEEQLASILGTVHRKNIYKNRFHTTMVS